MGKLDSIIEELRAEVAAEIEAAYERGFVAGGEDMRDRILNAARGPVTPPPADVVAAAVADDKPRRTPRTPIRSSSKPTGRAPRGAVGEMLQMILTQHPGLTISAIEDLASQYDPDVALKSIGNSLRRFEGEKYRRASFGRWFLIGDETAETESAGERSPADEWDDERSQP